MNSGNSHPPSTTSNNGKQQSKSKGRKKSFTVTLQPGQEGILIVVDEKHIEKSGNHQLIKNLATFLETASNSDESSPSTDFSNNPSQNHALESEFTRKVKLVGHKDDMNQNSNTAQEAGSSKSSKFENSKKPEQKVMETPRKILLPHHDQNGRIHAKLQPYVSSTTTSTNQLKSNGYGNTPRNNSSPMLQLSDIANSNSPDTTKDRAAKTQSKIQLKKKQVRSLHQFMNLGLNVHYFLNNV